jgi:hypothetical protein
MSLPVPSPGGGDLNSKFIRDVRRAVIYEYRHGHYPDHMSEAVADYLTDGGLINALTDLEAMLTAREAHRAQRNEPARRSRLLSLLSLP